MTNVIKKFFTLLIFIQFYAIPSYASEPFLVISDIHLNAATTHVMDVTPNVVTVLNDLDVPTYKQLIAELKGEIDAGVISKPFFILLLGDLSGHHRIVQNTVVSSETIVFETLKQAFPNTPIFYTFGNNDSLTENYGSFRIGGRAGGPMQSPIDIARSVWHGGGFLSTGTICSLKNQRFPCVISSNTKDGYYAAYLRPKLRFLSLNSVMFSTLHKGVSVDDQTKQLLWVEQQLTAAHRQQESVLLVMHVPPGKNVYDGSWFSSNTAFWDDSVSAPFLLLVERYHQNIIGILAAHTHKDELKVIRNKRHHTLTGVYMNAALSTSHGNAPSVRLYRLGRHKEDWFLRDYSVYYFRRDLKKSMQLTFLYHFRSLYCKPSESSMNDCLDHVTADKIQRFFSAGNQQYYEKLKLPDNIYFE